QTKVAKLHVPSFFSGQQGRPRRNLRPQAPGKVFFRFLFAAGWVRPPPKPRPFSGAVFPLL
ncbi:MAG: hypothetical protein IJY02_00430, partial [Oscillospiraceae bacterium]|nr:hypothetical protein [Oscillospiraceae bacterium]